MKRERREKIDNAHTQNTFSLLNSLSIFALEQYFEIQIAFHNSQIIMRPSVRVNKGKINKKLKENNKSIASQENNRMETELER